MPRTVWSGAISFDLVTVTIHVVSAVEDHSIRFHRVHLTDMARVRTRKVCELEDREVSTTEIGKGYEISRDHIVPVSDEELRDLPLPTAKAIEIVVFICRCRPLTRSGSGTATTWLLTGRWRRSRTRCSARPSAARRGWPSPGTPGPAASASACSGSVMT
jgi:hypothetical protein